MGPDIGFLDLCVLIQRCSGRPFGPPLISRMHVGLRRRDHGGVTDGKFQLAYALARRNALGRIANPSLRSGCRPVLVLLAPQAMPMAC